MGNTEKEVAVWVATTNANWRAQGERNKRYERMLEDQQKQIRDLNAKVSWAYGLVAAAWAIAGLLVAIAN